MPVKATLKYHVPGLGELKSDLYENSSKAYNLLKENGHIDRLKSIDQLGVIRNVYEGAHHSRWEYVMLQLGVLHRLNTTDFDLGFKPSKGTGLSSNVSIGNNKPTYFEIIQMWILLLNMGHLPGTFSSEKALIKCIKEDSKLQKIVYDSLPSEGTKKYFEKIIENESIYEFHKVLSFFYLIKYKEKYAESDPDLTEYLIKILEYNCIGSYVIDKYQEYDDSDKEAFERARKHLKQIFFKVRQISYLYLDSKYGPTPFNFELETVLINLPEYVNNLFIDGDSYISQSISDFDKLLSATIYLSEDSLQAHGLHVRKTVDHIKNQCIDESIYDSDRLLEFLKDSSNFQYKYSCLEYLDTNTKIKFSINTSLPNNSEYAFDKHDRIFKDILNFDLENCLNTKYGIKECIVSVEPSIKQDTFNIAFSFFKSCTTVKRLEILGELMGDLIRLKELVHKQQIYHVNGFEKIYSKFILYTLNQICRNDCIFKYNNYDVLDLPCIGGFDSTQTSEKLMKFLEESTLINNSRRHELISLGNAIQEVCHNGPILVCPNQIKVLDRKRNELTDIDGIGFGYKDKRLYLLITEAKKQKIGCIADARKQLLLNVNEKLKINCSGINLKEEDIKTTHKNVYCYIPINDEVS
ncbi:hypothetical protein MSHOH_1705 [Methanosarcina horonobensis HB-1 = JCM 15518]|uniref:Uncharacterized protein n=1 Tax=Methanosarcina horonobensis HB-1 = JCM 15518 TaxID=1434110 RepID=A0A0E3SFD5_9EURY|nr:hypothetical protein [Methanosarcina horonobensis]AKB78188.1 hypothetical protein MSHOH_1705 [Methanosarcina horonobensis HB-1 = JCM 15518]